MTAPLASCIIPVYNGADFLAEAVTSALTQTYPALEVVIVDDGSTDRTPEVARSFGERVRYLRQENAGPAVARNTGLAAARGELVAFLDADDRWDEAKMARQAAVLGAQPELDYVVALVQNFWTDPAAGLRQHPRDHPRTKPIPGYVTGTLLAHRALFDRVGGFDPERSHTDATEWFLRARAAGARGLVVPEVLLYRRMHTGNRSRQMSQGSTDEFLRLLKTSLDQRRSAPEPPASVSCIIPVYNGERFLGAAVASVLAQTRQPVEIIIVDDGSTDGTPEVIAGYGDRVRSIRQENAGPAAARNAGIAMATGAFIGFLDADDLWLPEKLALQMAELVRNPKTMICLAGMTNFRDTAVFGGPEEEWPGGAFSPCTMLVRAPVFRQIGGFDPKLRAGEDTEWFCRVMMGGIAYTALPDILVRRRLHDRNLTRVDPPSHQKLLGILKLALDKKRAEG
ncbi:MAG TPA: glycosyltransferase family A protein [Gemmatimonadales bacterium]|nr:glycosyltransferase family A protein [Gemmatimonadales bacterium]